MQYTDETIEKLMSETNDLYYKIEGLELRIEKLESKK